MPEEEVIEPAIEQQEFQQEPPDKTRALYDKLYKTQLYTNSYDDFKKKYNNPQSVGELYKGLADSELYIGDQDKFINQYFGPPKATVSASAGGVKVSEKPLDEIFGKPAVNFASNEASDRVGITQLSAKAKKAQEGVMDELHGNDKNYEQLIRDARADSYTIDDLKKEYHDKGFLIPIGKEQEFLKAEKQRRRDQPVSPEDISDAKTGVILNEEGTRNFIKKVNNKTLKANAYLVDAHNSAVNDPNGSSRAPTIVKNKQKIEKGEYDYDPETGALTKPEGFFQSLITSHNQLNKGFADYDFFTKTDNKSAIVSQLESDLKNHDPDEAVKVPEGFGGHAGAMIGGMPPAGLLAGGIASMGVTALGNPEAAPTAAKTASAAVSAYDFYRIGKANAIRQNYAAFRQQGLDPNEAYDKALPLAEDQAKADAVSAAAMGFIGFDSAFKPVGSITKGFETSVIKGLTQIGELGAKKTLEGLGVGATMATGQIVKNIMAQQAGIPTSTLEGTGEQVESGLMFTLGASLLAKSTGIMRPKTRTEILQGLVKADDATLKSTFDKLAETGEISTDQAHGLLQEVQEHRALDQAIPENIPEEARLKIQDKITKRNELEEKIKNTDKAFHEDLKEKVKKLNEDILELAKPEEKTEAGKIIDKAIKSDKFPEVYQETAKNDPEGFLKFIADQSFGRDEKGVMQEGASAEPEMRQHFGDELVDKAKELFPITKAEENAIPIGEPEKTNVDEASGNSGTLGEGVLKPEEAAGAQETQSNAESEKVSGEPDWIFGKEEPQPAVSQPETSGITHAEMDKTARDLGLPEYEGDPETVEGWDAEAVSRMQKDPNAMNKLFDKLRNGGTPDAPETRMMIRYMADLKAKYNKAPTPEILNDIKRAKDLFNIVGREQGKAFRARKDVVPTEETLADFHMRDTEYNKAPLTEEQQAKSTKEYEDISAVKTALEDKVAKLEAANARLKAEQEFNKAKPGTRKPGEKKDFKGERRQIIEDIREKLKKARGETSIVAVPYAKELIAIAPDVAKLVRNLVEEGVDKLPAVVKAVHDQLKDLLPDLTETDVHNIIAGEYNTKKESKNELALKLENLRIEARLINRLDELERGETPKAEKKIIKRNREIEELRQKIKDLKRGTLDTDTPLDKTKDRLKKQIAELEERLKTGDFEPVEKKAPIELDDEALKLKNRLIELKQEREKRLAQMEYEKRSMLSKAGDLATNVLNVPRTIMASADFSAPFRQGLVATVSHPSKSIPAFVEMFKQAFSQKKFDIWLHDLKESPEYQTMEQSGLYVADPNNLKLSAKEEAWMSNLAEKIPVVGKAVKGSERAYVAYLNKLRTDIFTQGVDQLQSQGKTLQNSPEVYKALASFINNSTGRGELGKLEDAAQVLNTAFFSPRLIASRINLLNPLYYTKLPKEVRIMALKDMAKTIGFGLTIIGLSKAAGADVEDDPRSPDFGKVKIGNTRYDTWGGFQQYVRVISQLISGSTKSSTTGKITDLTKDNARKTRADVVSAFFRGKLAPVPGTVWDFAANKTVTGEKPTIESKAMDLFVPMIVNDTKDAWKDQGFKSIFTVGVPSSFGVGVSTYSKKKK